MQINYKIEVFMPTNESDYFWCIVQINPSNSYNIGHGIASSYFEAIWAAYNYWRKYVTT